MKFKFIPIILVVIYAVLIFIPKASYADSYVVKPLILIPKDWKNKVTKDELAQYKRGILSNLNSVKQFYANQLNGTTFNIDESVEIIYSNNNLAGHEGEDIRKLYETLNNSGILNTPLIRPEDGKDQVVWVIGSQVIGNTYAFGGTTSSKKAGVAVMPYEDLLAASGQGSQSQQQYSKYTLAHELGHTFYAIWNNVANGHPCTEVSPEQCKSNVTDLAPAYEWTSVMGYGTPSGDFPNLFFNNTNKHPELQVICRSPFINCSFVPPLTEPKTSDKVVITGLSPNTIVAGQTFEVQGSGFDHLTHFRMEKLPGREYKVTTNDKLKMVKRTDGLVVLQTPEELMDSDNESEWVIFGVGSKGDLAQGALTIKGKQTNSIMLENQVKVSCGSDKEPVPNITVYLLPEENDVVLAQGVTDNEGFVNLSYSIKDPVGSDEYHILTSSWRKNGKSLNPVTEEGDSVAKIYIPNPPADFTETTNFNFAECLDGTGSSSVSAALGTPTPEPTTDQGSYNTSGSGNNSTGNSNSSSQSQVTKVQISNYPDFRSENDFGDMGSKTVTIDDPASYRKEGSGDSWDELRQRLVSVDWHLNTLSSDAYKKLYVRVFESDNYTDYQYLMENEEVTQVPFDDPLIAIRNQVDNKLIKATVIVNGQNIDIDLESGTQIHLEGDSSKDEDFDIAYEIEDAKEGVQRSAIKVAYRLPGKTVKGFYCSGNQMMKRYTDDTSAPSCTCGDDAGDCTGGTDATICEKIPDAEANAAGLESDAKCVTPGQQTPAPSSSSAPRNYCTDAGYVECEVGEKNGTCTKDGQTCTAYNKYVCNFNGKNYCDSNNPTCGDPCSGGSTTQVCTPYSQGPVCDTNWCSNGEVCGQGHKYCLWDGSDYGNCSEEVNNCAQQCVAPPRMCYFTQVDDYGDPDDSNDDIVNCYEGTCKDNNDCWTNHNCEWNGAYNGTNPVGLEKCN